MAYPAITSYSWNFGDGATSTSQNPTHVYSVAGTYTVSLTITNAIGDTDTRTIQVVAKSILTPIVSTVWDFGDGESGNGVTIDHLYDTKGWFRVSCTVQNGVGDTAIQTMFFRLDQNVLHSAQWDFGDGRSGSGQYVDHQYFPGTHTPSLVLVDVYGNQSDRTYGPTINVNTFRTGANPTSGPAPLLVNFSV